MKQSHVIDDSTGEDPEFSQLINNDDIYVITPPFNLGHQRLVYALLLMIF